MVQRAGPSRSLAAQQLGKCNVVSSRDDSHSVAIQMGEDESTTFTGKLTGRLYCVDRIRTQRDDLGVTTRSEHARIAETHNREG